MEMIEAENNSADVRRWIARDAGTDEVLGIARHDATRPKPISQSFGCT